MKNSIKTIIAVVVILLISAVMLLTFFFLLGGDKQPYTIIDEEKNDDALSNNVLLSQTYLNNIKTYSNDEYVQFSTSSFVSRMNRSDINDSNVKSLNAGGILISSLPSFSYSSGERDYTLSDLEWNIELNGPYHARSDVKGQYFTPGNRTDFEQSTTFSFSDQSSIDNWSSIRKGCKITGEDDSIKVSVNSSEVYFGNGKLSADIPVTDASENIFVRIKIRGTGIRSMVLNYSTDYQGLRLQGSKEQETNINDDWSTIYIEMDDSTFIGKLTSFYFSLDADEGAVLYIDSITKGTIGNKSSDVNEQRMYTIYSRNMFISSDIDFANTVNVDYAGYHMDFSTEDLTSIEYYDENGSNFSAETDFTTPSLNAINLYYKTGDVISIIPDIEIDVRTVDFKIIQTDNVLRITFILDQEKINSRKSDVFNAIFRISIDKVDDVKDMSSLLLEEEVPLDENNVVIKNGEFLGYDKKTGSYTIDLKDNEISDIEIMSEESRFIYLNILNEKGQVFIYEKEKMIDDMILLSDVDSIIGLYLPAGEKISFSIKQSSFIKNKYMDFCNIEYTNQKWERLGLNIHNIEYLTQTEEYTKIRYNGSLADDTTEVHLTITEYINNDKIKAECDLEMIFTNDVTLKNTPKYFNVFGHMDIDSLKSVIYLDVSDELMDIKVESLVGKQDNLARLSNDLPLIAFQNKDNHCSVIYLKDIDIILGTEKVELNTYITDVYDFLGISTGGEQLDRDTMDFVLGDHVKLTIYEIEDTTDDLALFVSNVIKDVS